MPNICSLQEWVGSTRNQIVVRWRSYVPSQFHPFVIFWSVFRMIKTLYICYISPMFDTWRWWTMKAIQIGVTEMFEKQKCIWRQKSTIYVHVEFMIKTIEGTEAKWPPRYGRHIQNHFLWWKCFFLFWIKFHWSLFSRVTWLSSGY